MIREILELDQYTWKDILRSGDELIDQVVIFAAAKTTLAQADIVCTD